MKVKSESEVAQLCLTLGDPMDCSLPGSSAHGIFQARVLEWGAIAFSDLFAYLSFLNTLIMSTFSLKCTISECPQLLIVLDVACYLASF